MAPHQIISRVGPVCCGKIHTRRCHFSNVQTTITCIETEYHLIPQVTLWQYHWKHAWWYLCVNGSLDSSVCASIPVVSKQFQMIYVDTLGYHICSALYRGCHTLIFVSVCTKFSSRTWSTDIEMFVWPLLPTSKQYSNFLKWSSSLL